MANIIIIVGLPGSGKSHLGKAVSQNRTIPFYDDCITEVEIWEQVEACLRNNNDCVLADPGFCISKYRDQLVEKISDLNKDAILTWIYFDNDPEVCIQNLKNRSDGRIVSETFARQFSKWYTIPKNTATLPCYRGTYEVKR